MNIYFDLDGVLVEYQREAYQDPNSKFYQVGGHYFRDLPANKQMIAVFQTLQSQNNHNLYGLTSVTDDINRYDEHCIDKQYWMKTNCPLKCERNLIFAISSKRDCIETIQKKTLNQNDILIDDFNPNLEQWREGGGTAIKYLNGLNNPDSYNGLHIHHNATIDEIITQINHLERDLITHENKFL